MVSTKDQPGAFDGMERAQPGEPVFTLRAHDVSSTELVLEWCARRRERIMAANLSDEKRAIELIQVRDAEEIAWAMDDWRKGRKDVPAEVPSVSRSYAGNEMDESELEAKIKHDALKGAAGVLHNAVAEVTDIALLLRTMDKAGEALSLDNAVTLIKAIADAVQPKRASYAHKVTE
jgi:hypothetical protein